MRKRTFQEVFVQGQVSRVEDENVEDQPKKKLIVVTKKGQKDPEENFPSESKLSAISIPVSQSQTQHIAEIRTQSTQEYPTEDAMQEETEQLPRVIKTLARLRINPAPSASPKTQQTQQPVTKSATKGPCAKVLAARLTDSSQEPLVISFLESLVNSVPLEVDQSQAQLMRKYTDLYVNATQAKHCPTDEQTSENVLLRRLFGLQCAEVEDTQKKIENLHAEDTELNEQLENFRAKARVLGEKVRRKLKEQFEEEMRNMDPRGGRGGAGGSRGVDSC